MDKPQTLWAAIILVLLCCVILCLPFSEENTAPAGLCFSEICAKNETVLADNRGRYTDYIELYNAADPIDLTGYRITDGTSSVPLDSVILRTGEYRVFFLGQQTGLSLKAAGGAVLQLVAPDGTIAAQATTLPSGADQVMIQKDGYYILSNRPSPGFPNDETGILAFREGQESSSMSLVISELLVDNCSVLADEQGNFCDIAELYNRSEGEISLSGWYLSDSADNRYRFRLPAVTVSAGDCLLLYCDGENRVTDTGEIHTNFGLSYGEPLFLTDPAGNYHSVVPEYEIPDQSTALLADGTYKTVLPSPGYPNDDGGITAFEESRMYPESPLMISEVLLSASGIPYNGALQDAVEVTNLSGDSVSTEGWYLTDGTDPRLFPLPAATIAPGECLVIPCSRENTGFSLSEGETLRLFAPNTRVASSVLCENRFGQSICLQDTGAEASYSYGSDTLGGIPDPVVPQGLVISECMSSNSAYLRAADKTTCDWIELYNNSDTVICLSDYTISDDSDDLRQYILPEKNLKPGEYLCILLSEDGSGLRKGYSSLPFSLSAEGESLYLSKDGEIVDFMLLPALNNNDSYGRPQGSTGCNLLKTPTPGKANTAAVSISAAVTAVTAPGVYEGVDALEITLSAPGDIYYTTNCMTPDRSAKRYQGPIRITKTTVLRVVCYEDGKAASDIVDLTYLLNEGDSLSAISIVTHPDNLWNWQTGIYVNGPGWTEGFPHRGGNFWEDWEYPATISLFAQEGEGFVSVPFGLKIYGGFSRGFGKKSLACMFRAKYGASQLDYPVFGEEGLNSYEAIVLRAGGQEVFTNRLKDEVISSYVSEYLGIPVQKYRPVVVYLNGKYYGIHFIREKINENYVAGNFNAEKEDVQLTYWSGKYNAVYRELIAYMKTNKLTEQEHYDYIAARVDLENYTDYVITQMWIANEDTANVKFFCTSDQPWTWILYDTDMSMYDYTRDALAEQLKQSQLRNNDVGCKSLLLLLLENEAYREYFLERVAWQVNNVWNADQFIAHLDSVANQIAGDIEKDSDRWHGSYASWERHVERIRTFARNRLPYFLDSVQRHFDLTDAQMEAYGFILPDE